jgi:hypothetical protein
MSAACATPLGKAENIEALIETPRQTRRSPVARLQIYIRPGKQTRCRNLKRFRGFYRTANPSWLMGADVWHARVWSHLANSSVNSQIGLALDTLNPPEMANRRWSPTGSIMGGTWRKKEITSEWHGNRP